MESMVTKIQFTGSNYSEILDFVGWRARVSCKPNGKMKLLVSTEKGTLEVFPKDFIVKDINKFNIIKLDKFNENS